MFSDSRIILFILLSALIIIFSWRDLHNPKCHGFYRAFVFESTLILVLLNFPFWFKTPFSLLQCLSWGLLCLSIFFVIRGLYLLKKLGGSQYRSINPENFCFENTVNLVADGLYKYIRHPMYSSLLLLIWGALLKHITVYTAFVAVVATGFLVATAIIEEQENILFFGARYKGYIKKTKMFIPYVF